jgi:hypothetical protein
MADNNKGVLVGVVIVAVLFAVAAPWLRLVMVKMAVQDEVLKLSRFPPASQIVSLDETLTKIPTKYFVDESAVKTTITLEERDMGPAGIMRFVIAKVDYGKTITKEHRIETSVNEGFFEELEDGGVTVIRVGAGEDDEDDEDY